MKNNLVKYYVLAAYFCSTFVMLAQDPGTDGLDESGLSDFEMFTQDPGTDGLDISSGLSDFGVLTTDPGTTGIDELGTTDQTPGAPVDDYVWLLGVIGLIFVYMKFKANQESKVNGC